MEKRRAGYRFLGGGLDPAQQLIAASSEIHPKAARGSNVCKVRDKTSNWK